MPPSADMAFATNNIDPKFERARTESVSPKESLAETAIKRTHVNREEIKSPLAVDQNVKQPSARHLGAHRKPHSTPQIA